jgi:hypothetical protein
MYTIFSQNGQTYTPTSTKLFWSGTDGNLLNKILSAETSGNNILFGSDLSGINLFDNNTIDLSNSHIVDVNLTDSNIIDVDLENSHISADLTNAILNTINVSGTNFNGSSGSIASSVSVVHDGNVPTNTSALGSNFTTTSINDMSQFEIDSDTTIAAPKSIDGFFPLYDTSIDAVRAITLAGVSSNPTVHTHEFAGKTYYMPDENQGIEIYHGNDSVKINTVEEIVITEDMSLDESTLLSYAGAELDNTVTDTDVADDSDDVSVDTHNIRYGTSGNYKLLLKNKGRYRKSVIVKVMSAAAIINEKYTAAQAEYDNMKNNLKNLKNQEQNQSQNPQTDKITLTRKNNRNKAEFKQDSITQLKPSSYNSWSNNAKYSYSKNIMKTLMTNITTEDESDETDYSFDLSSLYLGMTFRNNKTKVRAFGRKPNVDINLSELEIDEAFTVPEMNIGDTVNIIRDTSNKINIRKIQTKRYKLEITVNDRIVTNSEFNENQIIENALGTVNLKFGSVTGEDSGVGGTAGSSGDPYITSANGKITKLPNSHGFYRCFDYDDIVINVEVDKKDFSKEISQLLSVYSHLSIMYEGTASYITDGYFNKTVFINSENNTFTINLFNKKYTYQTSYFKISKIVNRTISDDTLTGGNSLSSNSMLVEWTHSRYGPQSMIFDFYKNPQAQNGMFMNSNLLSKKDAKGILVRNYKAKLMKISSLEETTSKKIDKRLASTKDHYHNKTIKNKEVWVRGTNKGVSKV